MGSTVERERHGFSTSVARITTFWTVILYIGAAFALYGTFVGEPERIAGWNGVALGVLLVVFFVVYHLLYVRRSWTWPMPPRRAAVYFTTQLTLLFVLSRIAPAFAWLSWAMLGQTVSVLRPRAWALPMLPALVLLLFAFDVVGSVERGEWYAILANIFSITIFMAMLASIVLTFRQRYTLEAVVAELKVAKRELEQQAAQTEELAVLRERTRLAREMHDNLGHALVVIGIKLEAAQRLYDVDRTRGAHELDATKTVVRDTMAELRRSLAGLRAPVHEHQDLKGGLQRLVDDVRATSHLAVALAVGDVPTLAPEATEALWGVAREALRNIERHAAAAHVRVTLDYDGVKTVLRVSDDGVGIDPALQHRAGHYGIVGMRERMETLGGTLVVAPGSDGGTTVEATLPTVGE